MADGVERSGGSWGRATTSERKKTWRRKELHGNEERERGRKGEVREGERWPKPGSDLGLGFRV